MKIILLCILVLCSVVSSYSKIQSGESRHVNSHRVSKKYSPEWKDLDTRPLPHWYDDSKIGIFLHWGVYSVVGFSEWFWSNWKGIFTFSYQNFFSQFSSLFYKCCLIFFVGGDEKINKYMKEHYPPDFTYQDFAPMFKAEFFDPSEWADLFLKSGARLALFTKRFILLNVYSDFSR